MDRRQKKLMILAIISVITVFAGCNKSPAEGENKETAIAEIPVKTVTFEPDQFISVENCGSCHNDIYKMWEGSMHNLAHYDKVYLDVSMAFLQDLDNPDEIAEAESCVKCHTPTGYFTGYPTKTSDDRETISEKAKEGVSCDYCHSAVSADHMYNNHMVLEPGNGQSDPGVKRGPFDDAESGYHETAFSEFHLSGQMCGVCHNVKHVVYDTVLESTWDEWEEGPYNSDDPDEAITCIGCHMFQRPGIPATASTERPSNPGQAAFNGPEREHIFTHYFIGGNKLIPGLEGDETRVQMVEDRLQNAAELSLGDDDLSDGTFSIIVSNVGAGHKLPTGLTEVRQMWLEVIVTDESGSVLFVSGKTGDDGIVPEGSVVYNTIFGDGKGNPVINIAKAKEILYDHRIPPGESMEETFSLPSSVEGKANISVRLLYRGVNQSLSDHFYGKGEVPIPITVMEELEASI